MPKPYPSQPVELTTRSESETRDLAARLAAMLSAGDVLLLSGDLGAGKTTFTQGLAQGLEIHAPVTSPTFTLVQEYRGGRLPLYHFDLYRLGGPAEVFELGFFDYLEQAGVVVVEWPERLGDDLPEEWLAVEVAIEEGDSRRILLTARGARLEAVARAMGQPA
jgi:tRNA threonylcarbamoyladenosine biosynthesis protein TsaE